MFVGYGNNQKGYKCFDLEIGKTYVTMDVSFLENELFFQNQLLLPPREKETNQLIWWELEQEDTNRIDFGLEDTNQIEEDMDRMEENMDRVPEPERIGLEEEVIKSDEGSEIPRSSSPEDVPEVSSLQTQPERRYPLRTIRNIPPKRYREDSNRQERYAISSYTSTIGLSNMVRDFTKELSKIQIPNSVDEIVRDPKWVEAMEIEMKALENTQTWKLVKLSNEKNIVGCK
jgi:hypothetical protein